MAFVVVYDACVLYPFHLKDLLIRVSRAGLVQAKWTNEILDEVFDNILENRPDLNPENLKTTRSLMIKAIPDCIVEGYEGLVDSIELPDEDDRHVLAAAIRSNAQTIVTNNLKDFSESALLPYWIEAQDADTFLNHLIGIAPGQVLLFARTSQRSAKSTDDLSITWVYETEK